MRIDIHSHTASAKYVEAIPMIDAGQVPVTNGISSLTDLDKEKVLGGNAARLLGLTASA